MSDGGFAPSSVAVVVTPLAALAKDDMAVADNGGMPSIEGGGGRSDGAPLPFVLGGNGSPPAVVGIAEAMRPARDESGVSVPLSAVAAGLILESVSSALVDVSWGSSCFEVVVTHFAFLFGPSVFSDSV